MALLISEAEVKALVSDPEAYEAVRRAHAALHTGDAVNTVRARARADRLSIHTMSAIDRRGDYAAAKVYSAVGAMAACHVLLYRGSSGELLSVIEGKELGRLRTAAASLLAARTLAAEPLPVLGIFGAGYQAEGVAAAFLHRRDELGLKKVLISSRQKEHADSFSRSLAAIIPAESADAQTICAQADVIITATTSSEPLFEAAWVKSAKVICALGANSLIRRELPFKTVTAARPLVVDSIDAAKAEGGNLLPAIESGKLQWQEVHELGALLERTPERKGCAVFCSHGLAVQDLFLAATVYERAVAQGKAR